MDQEWLDTWFSSAIGEPTGTTTTTTATARPPPRSAYALESRPVRVHCAPRQMEYMKQQRQQQQQHHSWRQQLWWLRRSQWQRWRLTPADAAGAGRPGFFGSGCVLCGTPALRLLP
jgi:hypothetical protein